MLESLNPTPGRNAGECRPGARPRTSTSLRNVAIACREREPRTGTNLGPQPPKYRLRRGFGRNQKAGRVNNLVFPLNLQNLHLRFKSGRRLHSSLAKTQLAVGERATNRPRTAGKELIYSLRARRSAEA